jgi:uncharacterized membrane protein YfcA
MCGLAVLGRAAEGALSVRAQGAFFMLGMPSAVAAGTELYLAVFMGGWGALKYVFEGKVDIRLTMLLYLGSLIGVHIGAYGTNATQS